MAKYNINPHIDYDGANDKSLKDNYIYISHLDEAPSKYWYIPLYPESVTDNLQSNFSSSSALGRTAPIFTYSSSGPRSVSINLTFHRDMFDEVNQMQQGHRKFVKKRKDESGNEIDWKDYDYVDDFIKALQAIALPKFNLATKAIEPPMVAVRLGSELFVKGIVNGGINVTYGKPILSNNKYAIVSVSFTVSEIDPYDADSVYRNGSFRGYTELMKKHDWSKATDY